MAKQSQLDKAIAALFADIAVLQAAKARLVAQQEKAPVRRPRAVPAKADSLPSIEEMSGLLEDATDGMPLGKHLEHLRDE